MNNLRSNIDSTPSFTKRAAKGLKEPTGKSFRMEGQGASVVLHGRKDAPCSQRSSRLIFEKILH